MADTRKKYSYKTTTNKVALGEERAHGIVADIVNGP